MKQLVFMALSVLLGTAGSFLLSPVYGLAVYYLFAVLRPQALWEWVELFGRRAIYEVNWSFPVAIATLLATAVWRAGLWTPFAAARVPWYGNPGYGRSHYLFLAFTAWIGLTGLTAIDPEVAWPNFVEYAKIFVMFVCATFVLRTTADLWLIYAVMVAGVGFIAYELNYFYFAFGWLMLHDRTYGGLDNNGVALLLAMGVPLAFFAWEAGARWWRWAALALVPVLGHAVLLTYSRGAMLALVVASVWMWVRARNKRLVSLFYAAGLVLLVTTTSDQIAERFASIGSDNTNPRWVSWGVAVRMANERPVLGFGLRNSNLFTFRYGADEEGRTIHSQYLQIAADSGWVGCGLYVALLLSVFLGLWRVRRAYRGRTDPHGLRTRSLVSGLECTLVLFCVGASFLSYEHVEMPYIVMLLGVQVHAIVRAADRAAARAPAVPVSGAGAAPVAP